MPGYLWQMKIPSAKVGFSARVGMEGQRLEEHPDIETKFNVTQDVTQEKNLDQWIEYQIAANPKITTDELAELSGKTSRTIKRHLVKLPHIRFIGSGYSGHWEIDKK